jgi:hypothetical protein
LHFPFVSSHVAGTRTELNRGGRRLLRLLAADGGRCRDPEVVRSFRCLTASVAASFTASRGDSPSAGDDYGSRSRGGIFKLLGGETGRELIRLGTPQPVGPGSVRFTPGGHRLLVVGKQVLQTRDAAPLPGP